MILSINSEDLVLCIDGECHKVKKHRMPKKVFAVQFESKTGHLEMADGTNQPIKDLKKFKWLSAMIEEHQTKVIAQNTEEPEDVLAEEELYWEGVKELEKDMPVIEASKLSGIMLTVWPNLTLTLRTRGKDILGIDVIKAVGAEEKSSTTTLRTIKKLFERAIEEKVPLFSDVHPQVIDKEKYCKYLEECGARVRRTDTYCYMTVNA